MTQVPGQRWPAPAGYGGYGPGPVGPPGPVAPPSTRALTVTTWISFGVAVLLLPLMVLWLMQGMENLDDLRSLAKAAAGAGSGDGKGLKGGAEAIAWWEFLVVLEAVTLGAVAVLAVVALVAGTGRAWARVLCTVLILFPISVIIFGVIDSGPEGMYGLVFLLPFVTMLVLWWLPATSRGMLAKAAARAGRRAAAQPWR